MICTNEPFERNSYPGGGVGVGWGGGGKERIKSQVANLTCFRKTAMQK